MDEALKSHLDGMETRLVQKMRDSRKIEADQSNLDSALRGRVDNLLAQIEQRLGK